MYSLHYALFRILKIFVIGDKKNARTGNESDKNAAYLTSEPRSSGAGVNMGDKEVPQFEKPAKSVAQFQRNFPGLILLLKA